jgi:hypothetical protein
VIPQKVLALPFYSFKGRVSHTPERMEREERENKREGGVSQSCIIPLPLPVDLDGPIDDWDIPMLQPCLSPVPCVGVMGQSWRSIPPGRAVWSADPSDRVHARVGGIV